jgi:tripartite-type tricarboxylate transporter receptor subunit TctC
MHNTTRAAELAVFSRRRLLALLCPVFSAALAAPVQAQGSWPSRPIRIVVAYPAGGISDTVARTLADKLALQLNTQVVVENRAGASGSIGMDVVAKAAPDGYTFGFAAISPLALNPHLGKSPFDPQRDVVPVASVMYSPVLLLATPALDAKDLPELLARARARPGAVRWATSGPASLGHIMLEQLKASARVDITHVPYKGGSQQITDALGGQFEVLSTNTSPAVVQHIKAGMLRALAVGAPTRVEAMPNVPTLAELGFAPANMMSLFGVFAPAGVPASVLHSLNAEINKALALADVRSRLMSADNVPMGGTSADFARQIAAESENNLRIIRAAGIRSD